MFRDCGSLLIFAGAGPDDRKDPSKFQWKEKEIEVRKMKTAGIIREKFLFLINSCESLAPRRAGYLSSPLMGD